MPCRSNECSGFSLFSNKIFRLNARRLYAKLLLFKRGGENAESSAPEPVVFRTVRFVTDQNDNLLFSYQYEFSTRSRINLGTPGIGFAFYTAVIGLKFRRH